MKTLRRLALGSLLCAAAVVGSGCGGSAGFSATDAELAADSTDTADVVSGLTSVSSDGVDVSASGLTGEQAATAAAASAGSKFILPACLTKNVTGNVATYTLNSCSGPYGLVLVTGTLTATYTVAVAGGTPTVNVNLVGTGIKVNGMTVDVATTAKISGPTSNRTASVTSTSKAVTQRGNTINHSGMYDATWDGMCLTLSGSFATQTAMNSYATLISGYKKCQNACPSQGTVTFTNLANTLTITYTGGRMAKLVLNAGKEQTLNLLCQG